MIDCFIYKDEVYFDKKIVIERFIANTLGDVFWFTKQKNVVCIRKSECLFGNSKEQKKIYPELFI